MFDVIIAASGKSSRVGAKINKLLMYVNGRTVIENSILPFLQFNQLGKIIVATSTEIFDTTSKLLKAVSNKVELIVGGASRTETVKIALNYVTAPTVLIHDGARPFISAEIIERVLNKLQTYDAVIPTIPLEDTISNTSNGFKPVNRSDFSAIQTPQGFNSKKIKFAYNDISTEFTDDATVYAQFYDDIEMVLGAKTNRKITTSDDLSVMASRVGIGYDTHRLVEGRKLILGGVEIPYKKGLLGHSDADVLTHAIMDAILSALGEKDIGFHFPDNDEKYKDISSINLLLEVLKIMSKSNMQIFNLSATILAEKPKLAPYISAIKKLYSEILNISENQIGIAATTTEGVGDIGKGLAISAVATVSLILG
ncbi:MAG: 2-C-methyl-D-erythritol 2,4-cyclodiphosphate synthase [Clostridia bacterium]